MGIPRELWVLIRGKQWNGILQIIVLTSRQLSRISELPIIQTLGYFFGGVPALCKRFCYCVYFVLCTLANSTLLVWNCRPVLHDNFSSSSSPLNHCIEAQVCSWFGGEAINRRLPVTWLTVGNPFWVATNDAPSHLVGRHTLCLPKWRWSCSRKDGDSKK